MKLRSLMIAGLIGLTGFGAINAQDEGSAEGEALRKALPRSPESLMQRANDTAAIAEIVRELGGTNTEVVIEFIDQLYTLRDKYYEVMQMEVKLQQSSSGGTDQKELMKAYVRLLSEEKDAAKKVIDTVIRDLEASESRMLQVMAKVFRIGDRHMKTTISNVRVEIKKAITYRLHNSQGQERAFYMDALRFLDQYIQ